MRPDLTVAIVSHGHRADLERCLPTVFAERDVEGSPTFDVHVIVNVDYDGAYDYVRRAWPEVRVTRNDRRRGFSANNNGIYRRSDSDFFMLLNPDTQVHPGAFGELWAFMQKHERAAIAGPKLLYPDGNLQLSCRRFPTVKSWLWRRTPLRRLFPRPDVAKIHVMDDWQHDEVGEVDWMFGACFMVRRAAADRVGLLDEDIFLFCEDIDWCYRFHQAGWKVYYVPSAVVTHDLDDAVYERYWGIHRFRHYRAMAQVAWKHRLILTR